MTLTLKICFWWPWAEGEMVYNVYSKADVVAVKAWPVMKWKDRLLKYMEEERM